MRDDDVRSSCFAALDVLCAKHGLDLPYAGALDQGFAFRGRRLLYPFGVMGPAVRPALAEADYSNLDMPSAAE